MILTPISTGETKLTILESKDPSSKPLSNAPTLTLIKKITSPPMMSTTSNN